MPVEKLMKIISYERFLKIRHTCSEEELSIHIEKSWEQLYQPGCIFETENLSDFLPAIPAPWANCVKMDYPTFIIEIYSSDYWKDKVDSEKIDKLLEEIPGHSPALSQGEGVVNGSTEFTTIVKCGIFSQKENIVCKDKIVRVLENNNYKTSVYRKFYSRYIQAEFLEDNKYFRIPEEK